MLLKPRWYSALPPHIRPAREKLEDLEDLRRRFQMRDDKFMVAIASSPWAVVRAQETMLESLRQQFPGAEERKLWSALILARLEIKLRSPARWDPPPDELRARMEGIEELAKGFSSWDDVLSYILELDRQQMAADSSSPQYLINELLARET